MDLPTPACTTPGTRRGLPDGAADVKPEATGRASRLDVPRHACDCHIHIYDPERHPVANLPLTKSPPPSWIRYREMAAGLGFERAVVVQPNAYGFDNRCALDAVQQSDGAARAIVVIPVDTSRAQLNALDEAGARGVRFMMVPALHGPMTWEMLLPMARLIADLGWHINLQLDGRDLPRYENTLLELPCNLVIDHNGKFLEPVTTEDPAFGSLLRLLDAGGCWVKLSGAYETSKNGPPHYEDVGALASALAHANPDRCLWATNWPHGNRSVFPDETALLDLLADWVPSPPIRHKILAENPAELYRF